MRSLELHPLYVEIFVKTFNGVLWISVIGGLFLSLWFHRRFQQENPGKLPYRWGFYAGLNCLVIGLMFVLLQMQTSLVFLKAHLSYYVCAHVAFTLTGWLMIARNRWALIFGHFLPVPLFISAMIFKTDYIIDSFFGISLFRNFPDWTDFLFFPLTWILGGIYIAKRWKELGAERLQKKSEKIKRAQAE